MYTDVKPLSKYSDCVVISIQLLSTNQYYVFVWFQ